MPRIEDRFHMSVNFSQKMCTLVLFSAVSEMATGHWNTFLSVVLFFQAIICDLR